MAALKARHPGVEIQIREITSEGDRDRRTVLWKLKDAGFFTSRLEEVLLAEFKVKRGQLDALWAYVGHKGQKKVSGDH